mmetsp:Transcript_58127/g.168754  ORF Transcript_58127/g.168754 Transcript_58127/m.168754 type:complete len:459 (-) Transcript_58127:174-1550(-)|eukprot:CAMPEP_0170246122 /NCGR_PEP_ID=MMETSP0116_2-20130129/22847_1 /TAXON_ID=400756 /ORGANISM="Durinskia baltica, Strain CSIRO CS-38" /LENGTH=458 /DNA_ID=CAMNT_0010496997 /DNA_START=77 /DNA_END=1453 /DNA_ORIENTATION=-
MTARPILVLVAAVAVVHGRRLANPGQASVQEVEQSEATEQPQSATPPKPGRSNERTAVSKRRLGLAAVIPFLVGQIVPGVDALAPTQLGVSGAGRAAQGLGRTSASDDLAAAVSETALGMAAMQGDVYPENQKSLWPASWLNLFEEPEMVFQDKICEVYKLDSRSGDFSIGAKVYDVGPEQNEVVLRETAIMQRFSTAAMECIIRALDVRVTRDDGTGRLKVLVVMEPVEGSLREKVFNIGFGAVAPKDRIQIGVDILRGLRAIHKTGAVHRTISPDDIFVMRSIADDGRRHAKLGNFWNTMLKSEVQQFRAEGLSILAGKRAYIAPEVWAGKAVSPKSDVYAAGMILYQLAMGQLPDFFGDVRFRDAPKDLKYDQLGPAVIKEFSIRKDPGFQYLLRTDRAMANLIGIMLSRNSWLRPDADKALRILEEIARSRNIAITPPAVARLPSPAEQAMLKK